MATRMSSAHDSVCSCNLLCLTTCVFHRSLGCQFENSNEVGVFAKLTNAYCLVAVGGSENFYSIFESELADHIPVIHTSIAGVRIIGRLTAGTSLGIYCCTSCFSFANLRCWQRIPQATRMVCWFHPLPLIKSYLLSEMLCRKRSNCSVWKRSCRRWATSSPATITLLWCTPTLIRQVIRTYLS